MNLNENILRVKEVMGLISESYEDESGYEVFPKENIAYHTTPDVFLNQIQQVGLVPKSESKLSPHPERIYLFMNPEMDKEMTNVLWNATKKEIRDKINDYYVLQVDLTQLPNHKFYLDRESSFSYVAIYTLQPIPSSAIKVIKKIPTNDLKQDPSPEEQNAIDDEYEKVMSQFRDTNVNENILRVKELMNLNERLEDIHGVPVYHHTFEHRGIQIINSDSMIGTKPDDDILDFDPTLRDSKHQRMVSFTRDKNFIPDQSIGASVGSSDKSKLNMIFVVDLDKLKTRYKVVPYDYSSLDMKYYQKRKEENPDDEINAPAPRIGKNNEREERVLTDIIEPLRPYIINIIYKGDNSETQKLIDNYLGL